jgi:nicotinamide-nucleotide amidase
MRKLTEQVHDLAGEYIYALGDDPLEVAVGKMLRERGLSLSMAESCTGGYLAHMITSVPGSSEYFAGSIVAYSNEVKVRELGVSEETLAQHGAVSEATIKEMAENVRKKFNTDIGVATSGVAGPSGGSAEKPVGTVWIAYADRDKTVTRLLRLSKDRLVNIKVASVNVLNLIRTSLR